MNVKRKAVIIALCVSLVMVMGLGALLPKPQSVYASAPTSGLIGYWNFDAGNGSVVADSSGNNNNGTITGATWTASGKFGNGLSFDGDSDVVTIPDANSLDVAAPFSVSMWVNVAGPNLYSTSQLVLGRSTYTSRLFVSTSYGGYVSSDFGSPMDSLVNVFPTGSWHNVVYIADTTGQKIYVDGVLSKSDSYGNATFVSSNALTFGHNSGYTLNGTLDEVRLYNRALSGTEVLDIYNDTGASPPIVDTTPPSIPANLSATAVSSSAINLSWTASTDDVGVTGYRIYRGGSQLGTSTSASYSDTGLSASTNYSYNISAYDAAGNNSSQSASANATTQAAASGGAGWAELPNTKLLSVCPPDNFAGISYEFGGASPTGHCATGVFRAWNSAVLDTAQNRLIAWGGGHNDYYGNEVYALSLSGTPTWTRLTNPSDFTQNSGCPDANVVDGTPVSRHTYNGLVYMSAQDKMFDFAGAISGCGSQLRTTWVFDLASSLWTYVTPSGYNPMTDGNPSSEGAICAYNPTDQAVYCNQAGNFGIIQKFTYPTTWTKLTLYGSSVVGINTTSAIDPVRKLWLFVGTNLGGALNIQSISLDTGSTYEVTDLTSSFTGCGALQVDYPGLTYDSSRGTFMAYPNNGNTVYEIFMDTHQCVAHTFAGGPPAATAAGTFGRFVYSSALGKYIVALDTNANVYTLTLDAAGVPGDTTLPTASIISPFVFGTVPLSANATDNVGVSSVQFKLDGNNLGSPITSDPYTLNWDTTTVVNGLYTITAVVTDTANNVNTSTAVSLIVNN